MALHPLYPYQARAVDDVRTAYAEGARRIVLVLPTGGGKTRTATEVVGGALRKGRRVLWLAHREELVDQAAESMSGLGVPHGIVKAGRPSNPTAPIQVASVQTLHARPDALPPADIVIADETHHAVAVTWRAIIARYPRIELLLGLTATPQRADRTPLGDIYQRLIEVTTVAELQRTMRPDGHSILVPLRVVGPERYQRELFRSPITGLREFGRRPDGSMRPAILFAGSVSEARDIAAIATREGIRAACIDGETDGDVRKDSIARLGAGELDLLTNVFVATEGFDCPRVEVCAIARGCSAESTFLQMIGRALRSSPRTGKRDALLIDYRGLTHVHGLVDDETRRYSLDGRGIQRAAKISLVQCRRCGSVMRAGPAKCPDCSAPLMRPREAQRVHQAKAVELTARTVAPIGERRRIFDELVKTAREKGWKPVAVGMRFRARFGFWPPWPIHTAPAQARTS